MAVSFRFWDDCSDPQDMEAMWLDPDVRGEWISAGETKGQKVHISRDPDGQPYLTQTEMRVVAGIIIRRHFVSQIGLDMIRAVAELESDRQPVAKRFNEKTKEVSLGIMQILPKTAEWIFRELGYRAYNVEANSGLLYRPFVNVYFGAAYLVWLSNYENKERSEEFIVRAYKGGVKKAAHKSTLKYWNRYLAVKETLPSRKVFEAGSVPNNPSTSTTAVEPKTGLSNTTWESRASPEDMEDMWTHPSVSKEWRKAGAIRGKVYFSHDPEKRPYLSRIELKAIAEVLLSKHFSKREVKPATLCALADIVSTRFLNGIGLRPGLTGIDYPTACWLYKDLGYKAYRVETVDDLTKPFVSMYFGAAYLDWLSTYDGKERSPQFVVQAYHSGPMNVNLKETCPNWNKFVEISARYDNLEKEGDRCTIL